MAINRLLTLTGATAIGLTMATSAMAIPALQLYIEGATYCYNVCPQSTTSTQLYKDTWAISGTSGLRLWVMAKAPVYDVHFVASWNNPPANNNPGLVFTPVLVGAAATVPGIVRNNASAYSGITDTVLAGAVGAGVLNPALAGLQPNENKYDAATRDWAMWDLGDMTSSETNGADLFPTGFTGTGGTASNQAGFQLNVYDITFNPAALVGQVVNFDVWGCEVNGCIPGLNEKISYVNAPNSHDAQWLQIGRNVPEPASMTLLGTGLLGLGYLRRRKAA